jgi:hypothetical protein
MGWFQDFFSSTTQRAKGFVNNLFNRGKAVPVYTLDSTSQFDANYARSLYSNTNNAYKLAAGFVKPIINNDVAFMGLPSPTSQDDNTQLALNEIHKWIRDYWPVIFKEALRDSEVFPLPTWNAKKQKIILQLWQTDKVKDIIYDLNTGDIIQYNIEQTVQYKNLQGTWKNSKQIIQISEMEIRKKIDSNVETDRTPLNEMPLFHLPNEKESFESRGHSDIEVIEPLLKAYHDVLLMGLQSEKINGNPRIKISGIKDIALWIDNNFGAGTYEKIAKGTADPVAIENLDLIINGPGEDAEYITIQSTGSSIKPLLEILFTFIVEASETIEIIFGANLGTSLASVTTQIPVWIKKIRRKQRQFEERILEIYKYCLRLLGALRFTNYDMEDIKIEWETPDFSNDKEKAETFKIVAETLIKLLEKKVISLKEIDNELRIYIKSLIKKYEEHKREIEDTNNFLQELEKDSEERMLDRELADAAALTQE